MLFLHYRVILWLNFHVTFRMSLNEIVLLYTDQFIGDKVDVEDPLKKKEKCRSIWKMLIPWTLLCMSENSWFLIRDDMMS